MGLVCNIDIDTVVQAASHQVARPTTSKTHDRVPETLWGSQKSKDHNFLHRSYHLDFFSGPKNIFLRSKKKNIFSKSKFWKFQTRKSKIENFKLENFELSKIEKSRFFKNEIFNLRFWKILLFSISKNIFWFCFWMRFFVKVHLLIEDNRSKTIPIRFRQSKNKDYLQLISKLGQITKKTAKITSWYLWSLSV